MCSVEGGSLGLVEFRERCLALSEQSVRGERHGGCVPFNHWSLYLPDELLLVGVDFVIRDWQAIVRQLIFAVTT